ncbi:MAG: aminoacyl-tRNA hydrolase [Dethiobacter sp.]|nr:MAG: aminoacyl-tRNA hydrolase [Dethiobacter sp.]
MFLLVGLGNPGIKYALTRHNVGFWVIDELASRSKARLREASCQSYLARSFLAGEEVLLAKPLTFMNRSGLAVAALLKYFSLGRENLLVVYDDLDLPLGKIRLRPRGGSGGHKGMASIITLLQSEDFARLRLGIGRPADLSDEADYVLSSFSPAEERVMLEMVLTAADAVEVFLTQGLAEAMNRYNALRSTEK